MEHESKSGEMSLNPKTLQLIGTSLAFFGVCIVGLLPTETIFGGALQPVTPAVIRAGWFLQGAGWLLLTVGIGRQD